jgi:hypothetical protein
MYSDHPGGANVANGDGSVRFVSEFINQDVWRAVSSVADGEVVTSGALVMRAENIGALKTQRISVFLLIFLFLSGCGKPYPQFSIEQLKFIQGIRTAANTKSKKRLDAVEKAIEQAKAALEL